MLFAPGCMEGKTILITGASSGIGKATAIQLGNLGAECALVARDVKRLSDARAMIKGGRSLAYRSDLTDIEAIPALVSKIVDSLGRISGFVHCAGMEKTLPFRSNSLEDFKSVMDINFTSFCKLSQEIVRRRNHDKGNLSVVAISSVAAVRGIIGCSAYAASKGALTSLIKTLALEYAPQKIRFNSICPGFVDTPMLESLKELYTDKETFQKNIVGRHPLGIGEPQDIANAVLFLLSDASRWMTGTNMILDGGYSAQ